MESQTETPNSVRMQRRELVDGETSELYLTVAPRPAVDLQTQAREVYMAIRKELTETGAKIFGERMFATAEAMPVVKAIRDAVIGEFDDGVPPTCIVITRSPIGGVFSGAQIHAIRSDDSPTVLHCCNVTEGGLSAREFASNGHRWLYINGLSRGPGSNQCPAAQGELTEAEQARRMFFCAGCFLRQYGASMQSVPRTWLWLKDICDWYDDLNQVRRDFFIAEHLIDPVRRTTHLPASTGIGLYGADGAACTIDLLALPGREDEIELIEAGGDQRSAYEYGSAFSRAAMAPMPGGRTMFISGTAAIDEEGNTEHIDQVIPQVDDTIAHIRSLLEDADCDDRHVLTALAYCKTPAVERAFRERWGDLGWPRLIMVGDVCRPDLLFEVELTASPDLAV